MSAKRPQVFYCPNCYNPTAINMIHFDGFGNGVECDYPAHEECPNCLKTVHNYNEHCVNPYGNLFNTQKNYKRIYICEKVKE